jgi:glycosidase
MLLLTLRGTPTIYQGEEIGMSDVDIPLDRIQDPVARKLPGLGLGRDPERTPMQWDSSRFAGFSSVAPWLPLAPDAALVNVNTEDGQPGSMLSLYRRLIELRRATPALAVGSYRTVHADEHVLVYARAHGAQDVLVALNFTGERRELPPAVAASATGKRVVLSTYADGRSPAPEALRPDEGVILAS